MDYRPGKDDDQENAQKSFELIWKLIEEHPEIESTLWFSGLMSSLAFGCVRSGISYSKFCEELDNCKIFYKRNWNK